MIHKKQFASIENFWGILSQKVYVCGWEATNEHHLIWCINAKLSEIDLKTAGNLMKGVKGKLKSVSKEGVFFLTKYRFCVETNH